MSHVHPLEENDVRGESVESKHIDYLYEIAAIAHEHGTPEDVREVRVAMAQAGILTWDRNPKKHWTEEDDEYDGCNRDSSFISVEENVY